MKSECSEHQKKIAAYCLEDLSDKERQALEAHLSSCSQCGSERDGYERTLKQLASVEDEAIPRHFFIYPEERISNPLQLFRQISPAWQAALACAAILMISLSIAAISRLQIRSNSAGWAVGFGITEIDTAALKQEILAAAAQKDREAGSAWVNEMRNEISRSSANLLMRQKVQLKAALDQTDSRLTAKIKNSEGQVKEDTRMLISDMYRVVSQQRTRDLQAINLRLDSTEANNAVKAHQTNEILDTLLQVADLELR